MRVVIFKVNQLGDNVVFLPVLQWLREKFGAENLTYVTTPVGGLLTQEILSEENVLTFGRDEFNSAWQSPRFFFRLIRTVRALKPDLIIVPFDQGNVVRLLAFLSRAKYRIGVENPNVRTNWGLNFLIKTELASPMAEQDWAICQKVAELLLGETVTSIPPSPCLAHLLEKGIKPEQKRVMIHAGASRSYKCWPVKNFVALANRLSSDGFQVFWAQQKDKNEQDLSKQVEVLSAGPLNEFIAQLAGCGFFIGNNSGPMNLANALCIPSIIFSGPSPPKWDPYWHSEGVRNLRLPDLSCQPCDSVSQAMNQCQNEEEPMACMNRWTVDSVYEQFKTLLNRNEPLLENETI